MMWKFVVREKLESEARGRDSPLQTDPANNWVREQPCNIRGAVKQLMWSKSQPILAVNTITNVYMLREQELCAHYFNLVSFLCVHHYVIISLLNIKPNGLLRSPTIFGMVCPLNFFLGENSKSFV